MPVDYSKWDALELSDDSDIEVHPNVDKRSFIRAKQNQIHQEREQRKHEITTLKYERIINDGLLTRIDSLLTALKAHTGSTEKPDEIVFQSLIESAGDPAEDQPPPPPAGVHTQVKDRPSYSKMMAALVDEVKTEADKGHSENRLDGFVKEVGEHKDKVLGLQQELLKRLAELEKQEGSKITSESISYGFNSSHVNKAAPASKPPTKKATETVELLNAPKRGSSDSNEEPDSGAEADVEEDAADPDRPKRATQLGKQFGTVKASDYRASLQFISEHPDVLAERETDGLLLQAFDEEMSGQSEVARQCVHQALLLQYCRSLGRDGVSLFFKRITTKEHQARKMFYDDVNSTYARLRDRAVEMAKQEAEEDAEGAGGVEQIQLHAVNPGQTIQILVPSATDPEEAEARKTFDSFPPGLQRALETGKLDEVNKVLGKMSVEEAEVIVGQLGDGGMLSLEEGVIDATTDEGKAQMEEIEKTGKMTAANAVKNADTVAGEPGPVVVNDNMN